MIKVCRKKSKVNRDAWTHRRMLHSVQNVSRVKWRTRMLWSTAPKELRRKKRHSGISIPTRRGVWSHACLPTWLVRGVVGRTGKSSDYLMVLAIEVKIWSTIRNTKKQEEVEKHKWRSSNIKQHPEQLQQISKCFKFLQNLRDFHVIFLSHPPTACVKG